LPPPDPRGPEARLGALVRTEAQRVLSEAQLAADPARTAAGWERRFVIESPRVAELTSLYEQLGFEVAVDPIQGSVPVSTSAEEGCAECPVAAALQFCMVYTRRRAPA
jgi:hypothetical protein